MERVEFVPGQALPLFELKPPVFEGVDFSSSAPSTSSARCCCCCVLVAGDGARRARDQAHLARPRALPLDAARDRRAAFACLKFRTMVPGAEQPAGPARGAQRDGRRDLQDPRGPARDARWGASCGAGRSTSCLSSSTCCAARCRWSGPRPLPQRDYERLEDWHRKRYLVLPGMTGPVAGVRALRARLRRARAARLPLPRALVGLPRPDDPAEDDPRGIRARGAW